MNTKITITIFSVSILAISCGKKQEIQDLATASVDPVEASVESGVTMVSGLADDQSQSAYAMTSKTNNIWKTLLLPSAYADSCSRAMSATCNSGVQTATYNSCQLGSSSKYMSGSVTLTYSQPSCLLSNNGDSVTRTYDVDIQGPRGGVLSLSSDKGTDYRGSNYGGGGVLSKVSSGFEVQILGRHALLSYQNKNLYNVSTRTLSNLSFNQFTRSGRVWSAGQLEVNHNLAKFTAVITPNNVQWSAGCCHPTSGSLNITYSGSKSGSATVQFNSCGSAQVTANGQNTNIELSYCE